MTDAPTERDDVGAWARLRRRKVVQWGIAYAAGAWGLLQGVQFLAEAFEWSTRVLKLSTFALLVGLPVVLVLAWYHGDRGEQRVGRVELAIVTLLFLLGGALFWRYQGTTEESPAATTDTAAPVVAAPVTKPAPTPATDERPAIAVLPFVNMSPDKDQEFFADGLSEELLNLLAQVPQLRVIARTSSFSFKGKQADIAEIAKKLNVANVLEGSVRKSGDRLRVTAQLIRASDSSHIWSQTYDRQMTDVFKVQDEIAAAVVAQLKLKILGAVPTAKATDPKAYALYLQARQLGYQRTAEGFEQSIARYRQALAIDPAYASAWVGLARNYINQANDGLRPIEASYRLAREAVEKALSIDSDLASAHATLGRIAMTYDRDPAAAARHYEQALALEPSNTDIMRSTAVLASSLGRLDTAIALGKYVTARDPVNPAGHINLGFDYLNAGRLDEAIASLLTALSLSPGHAVAQYGIGVALLRKGEPAAALAAIQKESSVYWRAIGLPMAWHALGKKAESDAALDELIRKDQKDAAYNIAYVLAFRGEADRAFEWLDKAVAYRDPGLGEIAIDPLFVSLHHDPRWLPFLRKLGVAPEQLAAIKFDVTVPK